jgi:hypothetical protein
MQNNLLTLPARGYILFLTRQGTTNQKEKAMTEAQKTTLDKILAKYEIEDEPVERRGNIMLGIQNGVGIDIFPDGTVKGFGSSFEQKMKVIGVTLR